MKFLLASFAPKQSVPVWGTSNYILHIPKTGTYRRTTQTPAIGGQMCDGQRYATPHPEKIKVDNIKRNVAKSLSSRLGRHNRKGSGMAVI